MSLILIRLYVNVQDKQCQEDLYLPGDYHCKGLSFLRGGRTEE